MIFSKSDIKFFEEARQEALKSDYSPFHLGCVVVYKGYVVSTGHNSCRTHPLQKHYNKYRNFRYGVKPAQHSIHAEIDALSHISYTTNLQLDYSKVKVYIYRVSFGHKSGHGLARPCSGCIQALRDKGIRHIYYSTDDGFAYERLD